MTDIIDRLRGLADVFEAQQAHHNIVLHMRAGADEIERLRAGGCARDQGTTQYCAEAANKDAEIASLLNTLADERTESMRLRAALSEIVKQAETACKNVAYRKRIKFYDTPLNEAHDDGALETHEILGGIARAALEGKR